MTIPATPAYDSTEVPLGETVRQNIRLAIALRGMTGPKLAAALEVHPTWVSRRLNGNITIDLVDVQRIAFALDVTPGDLVTPAAIALGAS